MLQLVWCCHTRRYLSPDNFQCRIFLEIMFCKNCLPSRGNPRVHWWFPWQFHILSAFSMLYTMPAAATHNNLLPGSAGCEFIAIYRQICLVFTCTASCTCQSCAYLVHVWKHLCITGTEVLQQQFSIRSLFLFFFVLKPLLNLYESAIVMRIGNFLCSIRS